MVAKTLSISIPEEMMNFLEGNPGLSPSKVFQGALFNIQETIKHNPQLIQAIKDLEACKKAAAKIQEHLQEATEFITIKGYWEEFCKNEN